MKIAVWDTYVKREDDTIMHFDILTNENIKDEQIIYNFGNEYLKGKPFKTNELTAKECTFCHIEQATEFIKADIDNKGFSIIEMENCN